MDFLKAKSPVCLQPTAYTVTFSKEPRGALR